MTGEVDQRISMKTIREKHSGNMVIQEPFEVFGMVAGDIVVEAGGLLILHGMCTECMTLKEGGEATIHGTVSGDVVNDGGTLSIHGQVHGTLVELRGETTVFDGAKIARRTKSIGTK